MIKTQTLTPEVYYNQSRDFQFLGRLYDVVFNYLKTEIDLIRSFPLDNTQDTRFLELILKTLGFRNTRQYQLNQLRAVASGWISIIKNKGSLAAIKQAIGLILRVQDISNKYDIEVITDKDVFDIPTVVIKMKDLISSEESSLLEEILNYILPVGIGYVIQDVSYFDDTTPLYLEAEENVALKRVEDGSQLASLAKDSETNIAVQPISGKESHSGGLSNPIADDTLQGDIGITRLAGVSKTTDNKE